MLFLKSIKLCSPQIELMWTEQENLSHNAQQGTLYPSDFRGISPSVILWGNLIKHICLIGLGPSTTFYKELLFS